MLNSPQKDAFVLIAIHSRLYRPGVPKPNSRGASDRAGHGWSDLSLEPRTARRIAQELHALLAAAGIHEPYVLVGHSFGGYVIRTFVQLYRDEVVGMVLVDSIHPTEWKDPTAEQFRLIKMGRRYAWLSGWLARMGLARFCLQRLSKGSPRAGKAAVTVFGSRTAAAAQRVASEIRKLPGPILPMVLALWSQPKNFISLGQHLAELPVSAAQAAEVASLGDLPLVVCFLEVILLNRSAFGKTT